MAIILDGTTGVSTPGVTDTGDLSVAGTTALTTPLPVTSGGTGASSLSSITVGTATTATNLASGSAGTVPYQSASGTTAMLSAGTSGQFLTSNGAAAPSWSTLSTSVGDHVVSVNTGNGFGSTNNKIRRFTTTLTNTGTAITYADSASLGASFTITSDGFYSIFYADAPANIAEQFGPSLNSTQLTTQFASINIANKTAQAMLAVGGGYATASVTVRLVAGDVIRAHSNGTFNNESATNQVFIIRKVGNA